MDLIGHLIALSGQQLPPFDDSHIYEYVLAASGLFLRSKRDGMEAMIPVASCAVAGLEDVAPYVRMDQKVPEALLEQAIRLARDAYPNEILFWLNYESQAWELFVPDQDASCGSVRPLDPYHPIGAKALVDMHSHGTFGAMFSTTDNADETGFRVYVCLGRSANEIVARIGIFGYFWEFPASWVCDLPAWIRECEAEYGC